MYEKEYFPKNGIGLDLINKQLLSGRTCLTRERGGAFLGFPHTSPHPIAIKAYKSYLKYNTNHVGIFTNTTDSLNPSRNMEKSFIEMLGDLYGDANVDGYITSGGTEGNIMGVWLGKNYLNKKIEGQITLMKTYLTHNSITKACNINSIHNIVEIPVCSDFTMDLNGLRKQIDITISENVKKIIIIATVGYTTTGTCDHIEGIHEIIQQYLHDKDMNIYLHIDAAIGGLVYPFCNNKAFGFEYSSVKSITVDPHKMGYTPFSSGVFLCREGFLDYVSTPIQYSENVMDRTLVSSRNGAAAVACWATFSYLGFSGFKLKLDRLIRLKKYLVKGLMKYGGVSIISDPGTNMVCIHFKSMSNGLLPQYIEKKYTLDSFRLQVDSNLINCYKIYIMPHVTKKVIDGFISDIKA